MQIKKITFAVNEMEKMVQFYNAVFGCDLKPISETPFFAGNLAGTTLLFCPNSIAQVVAEKNRVQFDIAVDDVDAMMKKARQAGGSAYDDRTQTDTTVFWGVQDPDGNSLVLVQSLSEKEE